MEILQHSLKLPSFKLHIFGLSFNLRMIKCMEGLSVPSRYSSPLLTPYVQISQEVQRQHNFLDLSCLPKILSESKIKLEF